MSKLVTALKRTLGGAQDAPAVHFHRGPHATLPEVCHEAACGRPQLQIR